MAKVAYGFKADISNSINSGVIPNDCIIITKDTISEAFYLDRNGVLNQLTQDLGFSTMAEALAFAQQSKNYGRIITLYANNKWDPYIVTSNGTLMKIGGAIIEYDNESGNLTIE